MKKTVIAFISASVLTMLILSAACGPGGGGGGGTRTEGDPAFTLYAYYLDGARNKHIFAGEALTGKVVDPDGKVAINNGDWTATTNVSGYVAVNGLTGFTTFPYGQMRAVFAVHAFCSYWDSYSGKLLSITVLTTPPWDHRGQSIEAVCPAITSTGVSPNQIDVTLPPATIVISSTENDLASSYGPPRVVWYNEFSVVQAVQEPVSYAMDGSSVTISSPPNIGTMSGGNYALVVETLQSDGTYAAQDGVPMFLNAPSPPPPSDDPPCKPDGEPCEAAHLKVPMRHPYSLAAVTRKPSKLVTLANTAN